MSVEEIIDVTNDNNFIERKLKRLPRDMQRARVLLRAVLELDPKKRVSAE